MQSTNSSIPKYVWVRRETEEFPIEVSTEGCDHFDDFITAIKRTFAPDLDKVPNSEISLRLSLASPRLNPTVFLSDVYKHDYQPGKFGHEPLIIKVLPPGKPLFSSLYESLQ